VQQRVVAELDGLVREWQPSSEPEPQPEAVIAVISHADIIRLALAHYLNLALDDYTRLMVAPTSISMVQHDGLNRPRVISINQAAIFSWPEQISIKPGKSENQRSRLWRDDG
jgi:probable phosphoglycerate mutase